MSDVAILSTNSSPNIGIPLGPLMITAVLQEAGYQVDFRDYQTYAAERKPAIETFLSFLEQVDCSIIGLSVMANALPTVLGAVERYKRNHGDTLIILGGPAPSDLPREILERFPVDIIVVGEGEETTVELMHALESGRPLGEVAGLCYREDGEIRQTGARARIQNLDALPLPAYERIDFADYPPGKAIILTARGCPYECSFCSAHSIWQRQITRKSPRRVVEEICSVRDRITGVEFHDDTFTMDPERVQTLLALMRAEGLSLEWVCNGRINLSTPALLGLMADHGCHEVFYGIESGSDRLLHRIRKNITSEQGRRVVEQTAQIIGRVVTSYIWGYPFESLDDFFQTMLAVCRDAARREIRCQLGLLSPLPRSPLYQEYRDTIRFSTDIGPGVMLPGNGSLAAYPDLVELITRHPEIFSPFYYYDHDDLLEKAKVVKRMMV